MATLKFDTRTLRDALRWVIDHIDPKPANIADSALLLSPPKDGYIVLAGGSDHSAARARIPYTGDSFDEAKAVHAHSVNAIVKTAPAPNVEFVFNEASMLVKSGAAKSKVTYMETEETTAARTTTQIQRQGAVPAAALIDAIGSLSALPREDSSHPELAGVKVTLKEDGLALAATDRSILGATMVPFTAPENHEEEQTLDTLVPHRVLASIVRALPADGDVWLHWDPNNKRRLAMSNDNLWVSFALLASAEKFPAYEPMLTQPEGTTIEVDRKAFSAAMTRAGSALGREGLVFGISSHTEDGAAGEFTIRASGIFDHEEELGARVTGEPVEVALLSAQYVTQAAKSVGGETMTIVLGEQRVMFTSDHSGHAKFVIPRVKSR